MFLARSPSKINKCKKCLIIIFYSVTIVPIPPIALPCPIQSRTPKDNPHPFVLVKKEVTKGDKRPFLQHSEFCSIKFGFLECLYSFRGVCVCVLMSWGEGIMLKKVKFMTLEVSILLVVEVVFS